jgi:phosphatidate cytidylyltransferase
VVSDPVIQPPVAPPSELRLRVISALVLAGLILTATIYGGLPFRLIWAAVGGFVLYEWLTIMGLARWRAIIPAAALAFLAIPDLSMLVLLPAIIVIAVGAAALCEDPALRRLGFSGVAYAAVLAVGPAYLRDLPGGLAIILWSFAVTWGTDIAAYFVGRKMGGPKLSPRFSPKKTWSGAVGGALFGTAAGVLVWLVAKPFIGAPGHFIGVLIVSAMASIAGEVGDIAESALKRRFGVKDSSNLIPGHGGFMDRLDAYWAAIALALIISFVVRVW